MASLFRPFNSLSCCHCYLLTCWGCAGLKNLLYYLVTVILTCYTNCSTTNYKPTTPWLPVPVVGAFTELWSLASGPLRPYLLWVVGRLSVRLRRRHVGWLWMRNSRNPHIRLCFTGLLVHSPWTFAVLLHHCHSQQRFSTSAGRWGYSAGDSSLYSSCSGHTLVIRRAIESGIPTLRYKHDLPNLLYTMLGHGDC